MVEALPTLWFWLVALLVTGWAVLDGFDLGVGALHRFVARTDGERRQVLASIGPVWDGNEVWLLAAGGSMFLAFPRLVAAGFSGLYLPVIFTVWALIVRGASLELRSHLPSPLWRSFFDTTFMLGSLAVPVLMGVAFGNVVRGVPLGADGFFALPLFASGGAPGVLDSFTVLCGVLVGLVLTAHGASWLVYKTDGEVQRRAGELRWGLWLAAAVTWVLTLLMLWRVAPGVLSGFTSRPMAWLGAVVMAAGTGTMAVKRRDELWCFLGGAAVIAGALVLVVGSLFPVLLPARGAPQHSLTVMNAAAGGVAMSAALWWWLPGLALAFGYLWWVLKNFRGKAVAARDGEGY